MKIFEKLFSRGSDASPQNSVVQMAGLTMENALQIISSGGSVSGSGVTVTRETAMRLPAVFACVRLLSSTIAALPLNIKLRTENGSVLDTENPLFTVLHTQPNPMMTSYVWREVTIGHILTRGNAYSVIWRNNMGQPIGLIPIEPDLVTTFRENGRKFHKIRTSNGEEIWEDANIIHLHGFGYDGIRGLTPIENFARESLGQAQATQTHTSNFYKNGTNLGSILQTDQNVTIARQTEILNAFKNGFSGVENSKKVAMLADGFKFQPLTVNNSDAQLVETLKLQVVDIARIFGVPPHMIGDLDKATFSNIEQQSINYVQYSILPWIKKIEQELDTKLFAKTKSFVRFNLDGLLRGDYATRMDGHSKALNAGIFTINEVREIEGYNRIDGGDTLRVPLNMAAVDKNGFTAIDGASAPTAKKKKG